MLMTFRCTLISILIIPVTLIFRVNDEKPEFIIMYPKRFSKNICTENCVLSLENSKIKPTEKVRNLGSVFDSYMSMEPNISAVIHRGYNQL